MIEFTAFMDQAMGHSRTECLTDCKGEKGCPCSCHALEYEPSEPAWMRLRVRLGKWVVLDIIIDVVTGEAKCK
jgi:hypothetical protein